MKQSNVSIWVSRTLFYALLIVLVTATVIPLWVMISSATKPTVEIYRNFSLVPGTYLFKNLNTLLASGCKPLNALFNSLTVAALYPLVSIYSCSMMAYSLFMYRYKLRKVFQTYSMLVIMIPDQVAVIGLYKLLLSFNMTNTLLPLVLMGAAHAKCAWFLRQYMSGSVPTAIVEAARIDGSGEFSIFNRLIMPLMKPAVATQLIFLFVFAWNDLYFPSLILSNDKVRTLPVMIQAVTQSTFFVNDLGARYALLSLTAIPMIILYFFLSQSIISGLTLGSVKE